MATAEMARQRVVGGIKPAGLIQHGDIQGFILSITGSHQRVLSKRMTGTVQHFKKKTFIPKWRTDRRGVRGDKEGQQENHFHHPGNTMVTLLGQQRSRGARGGLGCTLKGRHISLTNGLDVGYERKRKVTDNFLGFGLSN